MKFYENLDSSGMRDGTQVRESRGGLKSTDPLLPHRQWKSYGFENFLLAIPRKDTRGKKEDCKGSGKADPRKRKPNTAPRTAHLDGSIKLRSEREQAFSIADRKV